MRISLQKNKKLKKKNLKTLRICNGFKRKNGVKAAQIKNWIIKSMPPSLVLDKRSARRNLYINLVYFRPKLKMLLLGSTKKDIGNIDYKLDAKKLGNKYRHTATGLPILDTNSVYVLLRILVVPIKLRLLKNCVGHVNSDNTPSISNFKKL